jgi:uncharacterized protein YbjQ (UPF0145 family)
MHPAMATTANDLPGFRLRSLGIAFGTAVRDPGFWDMWKSKRPELIASFQQARFEALVALMANALQLGANSIVAVRFEETPMPGTGASFTGSPPTLVSAYGTAAWAEPIPM